MGIKKEDKFSSEYFELFWKRGVHVDLSYVEKYFYYKYVENYFYYERTQYMANYLYEEVKKYKAARQNIFLRLYHTVVQKVYPSYLHGMREESV